MEKVSSSKIQFFHFPRTQKKMSEKLFSIKKSYLRDIILYIITLKFVL